MVEELREQLIREEELRLAEEEEAKGLLHVLLDLGPRKRLILASLLLFDVALCGCMALVMMGRVVPPF
jgi:hypothetical protein